MTAVLEDARLQSSPLRPLTERVLARLPGSGWAWIAAWALVPWLNAGANLLLGGDGTSAVWEQSDLLVVLNYVSLSVGVVVTLWGVRRIADRVEALAVETPAVLGVRAPRVLRVLDDAAVPVVLSVAGAIVFGIAAWERDGVTAALLRGSSWFVLGIAFWTFLWAYVVLQVGLSRLGRAHLRLDVARVDPSLGLRPFGSAAYMGLWMLLVWLVPVLLTGLPDVAGVVVGLLVLAIALALFFLSLVRLHGQMREVKERELALARSLYAEAFQPVRDDPTLETLQRQQPLLGAADALEKRAQAIHEWPIDEGTFAWVITITTSVIAMTIGRLILDPLGL